MDLESLEWFGLGDLGVTSAQSLLEVTAPTNGFAGLGKGFGWFILHSFYAKLTIQLLQREPSLYPSPQLIQPTPSTHQKALFRKTPTPSATPKPSQEKGMTIMHALCPQPRHCTIHSSPPILSCVV